MSPDFPGGKKRGGETWGKNNTITGGGHGINAYCRHSYERKQWRDNKKSPSNGVILEHIIIYYNQWISDASNVPKNLISWWRSGKNDIDSFTLSLSDVDFLLKNLRRLDYALNSLIGNPTCSWLYRLHILQLILNSAAVSTTWRTPCNNASIPPNCSKCFFWTCSLNFLYFSKPVNGWLSLHKMFLSWMRPWR